MPDFKLLPIHINLDTKILMLIKLSSMSGQKMDEHLATVMEFIGKQGAKNLDKSTHAFTSLRNCQSLRPLALERPSISDTSIGGGENHFRLRHVRNFKGANRISTKISST
eukprot:SAG31_NODE_10281_length_1161_cov_1.048023_1_plen_109_part_01